MAVVAGLKESGVFDIMAKSLTRFAADARTVAFFVIGLTFVLSMAITNDVALITLVPFSLIVLKNIEGDPRDRIAIVTLQTIAANVGSSLTPVGNPQNLYLFSHYGMKASDFFRAIGPIVLVGGIFLFLAVFTVRKTPISQKQTSANYRPEPVKILAYIALFAISVLAVFRIVDYRVATAVVVAALAGFNRKLFFRVDYSLLFTFVGFFVFIGNLQKIDAVRLFLTSISETNIVLVSALASQCISNVPAAILFSRFTEDSCGLLRGVSIGGMGTIIASLASVISFKFFAAEYRQHSMRYLGTFTVWNVLFFAGLYAANLLL
jgi:Na+/H+ antiporter NhaD/arsenite permease-like protein